jgi:formylglycine-generating enzyme required for sulfatase activity
MPTDPKLGHRSLSPGWGNERQPMSTVTRADAAAYCQWAGGRLPTEAEWEYAARGGTAGARYGDLDAVAWYADNSGRSRLDSASLIKQGLETYALRLNANHNGPHEVGQKAANGFGLYDMLGNVWEWVADWYGMRYYGQSPAQDPRGPSSGEARVLRSGSCLYCPRYVRASHRYWVVPGLRSDDIGFRCVREVP